MLKRSLIVILVEQMRYAIASEFPEGTRITRPTGGFVLWVELPKQVDGTELFEKCLAQGRQRHPRRAVLLHRQVQELHPCFLRYAVERTHRSGRGDGRTHRPESGYPRPSLSVCDSRRVRGAARR